MPATEEELQLHLNGDGEVLYCESEATDDELEILNDAAFAKMLEERAQAAMEALREEHEKKLKEVNDKLQLAKQEEEQRIKLAEDEAAKNRQAEAKLAQQMHDERVKKFKEQRAKRALKEKNMKELMEKKLNEMLEAERQKFLSVEASVQNQIAELQQSGSIRTLPTPTTPDPTRFISSPPVPERTRAPSTPVTPPPAHAPVHVPRLEASLPAVPVCGAKQPTAAIRSQTSVRPSTAPLKLEEPAPKKTKTVQILEDKVGKRTRSEAQPDEALISFNVLIL